MEFQFLIFKVLIFAAEIEAPSPLCTMTDPDQVNYEYHQFGNKIIGVIGSFIVGLSGEITFRNYPKMRVEEAD